MIEVVAYFDNWRRYRREISFHQAFLSPFFNGRLLAVVAWNLLYRCLTASEGSQVNAGGRLWRSSHTGKALCLMGYFAQPRRPPAADASDSWQIWRLMIKLPRSLCITS